MGFHFSFFLVFFQETQDQQGDISKNNAEKQGIGFISLTVFSFDNLLDLFSNLLKVLN